MKADVARQGQKIEKSSLFGHQSYPFFAALTKVSACEPIISLPRATLRAIFNNSVSGSLIMNFFTRTVSRFRFIKHFHAKLKTQQ